MDIIGACEPDNFFAGVYPIEKEVFAVAVGETIERHAPVKLNAGEVSPVSTVEDIADVYGISAENGEDGDEIVVYLTGEFFGNALNLSEGITLELLTPAFRNIGIFLKELLTKEDQK